MYKGYKISIYFPCRNENENLGILKKSIPKFIDEILIISNLSTDSTVATGKRLGFKVFEDNRIHKNGIGYGFANITGITEATGDIIIGVDADLTYPLNMIRNILDYFISNDYDFLSCNRYPLKSNNNDVPLKIRLGIFMLNLEVLLLYGYKINDILTGMWIIKGSKKEMLRLTEGDWNLSPQIKLNAITNRNINFGEFHIPYVHRKKGVSKQNYFRTGLEHMLWIFINRFKKNY